MDKPIITPAPGERLLRFVGDCVRFELRTPRPAPASHRAFLRTNLGREAEFRREVIASYAGRRPLSVAIWRDVPMRRVSETQWTLELPLTEPGFFRAKSYLLDERKRQIWPAGPDAGISVHPDCYRTANTIYCAFTRMFGATRALGSTRNEQLETQLRSLEARGHAVLPPSGKFRDLIGELPHIMDTLGCRILHLLPVGPTPAAFARMGRFGSPYACLDLTAIDPALVEFDRRTTGVQQFQELSYAAHRRGGKVILDVVINHTGWGSTLFETHPEWFVRNADGAFASPGAWGITWEDLVELEPHCTGLWEHFAEAFLTWCRRGVDGFRCDAGYKVPVPVWQYIESRVRQEFPDTLFLLEGLGGAWEATENLLTEGGMQWAYSELFQNYSGREIATYLDHAIHQSHRVGALVHYSETHDNERLAGKGRDWSLLRNRLCALTSVSGGFGFTCGVEWLADERIEVHQSRGLAWGAENNLVAELAQLNNLLASHPCFFDGAKLTRLSPVDSPVYALRRDSADGGETLLVLVNTDVKQEQTFALEEKVFVELRKPRIDLLQGGASVRPARQARQRERVRFILAPGAVHCLSPKPNAVGLAGEDYRRARAQAAWAMTAMSHVLLPEDIGAYDWRDLARRVEQDPRGFLAELPPTPLERRVPEPGSGSSGPAYPRIITWTLLDLRRITPVPPGHWVLIHDTAPFRAELKLADRKLRQHAQSVPVADGHAAFFSPQQIAISTDAELALERYALANPHVAANLRFLGAGPHFCAHVERYPEHARNPLVLLTNSIGGMARIALDLGSVFSKYDCVLGANLHPEIPIDRHIFVKRVRVWADVDGFITPLNAQALESFTPGPPAVWCFVANAGEDRAVRIRLTADMLELHNATVFTFTRSRARRRREGGKASKGEADVRLTVRVDVEDRNFHTETHRNPGAEAHFRSHCRPFADRIGFAFTPALDRQLHVIADAGFYHHEEEWSQHIPHPVEQTRGQAGHGDAWSPGWFELPLDNGRSVSLVMSADAGDPPRAMIQEMPGNRMLENKRVWDRARIAREDAFGRQLALAARAFVVRRGVGRTIIAGYPWFLDWGRDSLICGRGLLAAGMVREVTELLVTFGRFVENGTMPNTIFGEDASNRNTSDAPLWYGVVCQEAAALMSESLYDIPVDRRGRTIADVLSEIATGYCRGTPNGIHVDRESGLVWSPKHFTWMDTNHPAGTPREGYPVEIQVLWIRLLQQLEGLNVAPAHEPWRDIAERAGQSLHRLYWMEERGCLSDLLIAGSGQPARNAIVDTALRSNFLLAICFGFLSGDRARRAVRAAQQHLVIPGALRTLAPLPVNPPLPVHGADGQLLNNPDEPYWGRYEGVEDTQRKPAYHNGTAWTWTFPNFCEALVRAWDFSPPAVAAARAYLGSMDRLLAEGCIGHVPEILDGDAPHQHRGCDAQSWGATEALRVWKLLNNQG